MDWSYNILVLYISMYGSVMVMACSLDCAQHFLVALAEQLWLAWPVIKLYLAAVLIVTSPKRCSIVYTVHKAPVLNFPSWLPLSIRAGSGALSVEAV